MAVKKRTSSVRLDLSEVETRVLLDEGEYHLVVEEITQEDGDKAKYFKWKFRVAAGDFDGQWLYYNTSLAPQSLWNLRTLLEALEVNIPDEAFDLDLEELVGMEMMGSVAHEIYEGKKQSKLVDFWTIEGTKAGKSETKAGKSETKAGKSETKAAEDGLTEEMINDMDEDELKEIAEEHELEVDFDSHRTLRKKQRAVVAEARAKGVLADA